MSLKGIIHRDLKPENILLHSKEDNNLDIRIADFGYATYVNDAENTAYICGTPGYIAPELIKGRSCTSKSDCFSVGAILYNMLALKNLFSGSTASEILAGNRECAVDGVIAKNLKAYDSVTRNLVKRLLERDPNQRLTARHALGH